MKKDQYERGKLQFGIEVVSSKEGSITYLLGVSTATAIMLKVMEKAFPELLEATEGKQTLEKVVPLYNKEVTEELFSK